MHTTVAAVIFLAFLLGVRLRTDHVECRSFPLAQPSHSLDLQGGPQNKSLLVSKQIVLKRAKKMKVTQTQF